jgi:hypothetical protein
MQTIHAGKKLPSTLIEGALLHPAQSKAISIGNGFGDFTFLPLLKRSL